MNESASRPPRRRKLWILALVVVILIVGAVVSLPFLIDANSYRGLVESRARQALERDVSLGEMRVSLWPVFGLRVDDLVIAGLPEEGGGELLTAKSLRVGARLFPLLQRRLEVKTIVVQSPRVRLERGRDNEWNIERLLPQGQAAEGSPAAGPALHVESLLVTDGRISVRDAGSMRKTPYEVVVESLELEIEDLSTDRPLSIDLSAAITGTSTMNVRYQGKLGPLKGRTPLEIDGELNLEDVIASRLLGWFPDPPVLPGGLGDQPFSAKARVRATSGKENGPLFESLGLAGTFRMREAKLRYLATDGRQISKTASLEADYDVIGESDWDRLRIDALNVGVGRNRLGVSGSVVRRGADRELDLTLAPTRIPADDLSAILSVLATDLPVAFSSRTPVELSARVTGTFGETRFPDVQGQAKLADFTLNHASMTQPIENVAADVRFSGQRVDVQSFSGTIGASDVGGKVLVVDFDNPKISFELLSKRADLGEMFSFLREDESTASTGQAGEEALTELTLDGTLRVGSGSFETLDFSDLDMRMRHAKGILTLDPLGAKLYDGTFKGRIKADLNVSPPRFEIVGEAASIDTNAFLTDNLDSPDMLAGRFTGRVETNGAGADYESIARGLRGKGSMSIADGQVGKLDVLRSVSKVSGVFGEATLKRLTKSMAEKGTEFTTMNSGLRFEGGRVFFDDLILEAPEFALAGQGSVELLQARIDGKFRLAFTSEISESMRAEKSRAADVFWSRRTDRVEMPLTLSGPFDAPSASVDFGSVAGDKIRESVEDKLLGLLGGKKKPAAKPDAPADAQAPVDGEAPAENPVAAVDAVAPAEEIAPRGAPQPPGLPGPKSPVAPSGLAVEIDSVGWGGSFLVRDLELGGIARGPGIARAKLTVTDANGAQIHKVDPLPEIADHVASAADPQAAAAVRFWVRIEGKRLLVAKFPLVVRASVTDGTGLTMEAARTVSR